MCLSTYCLYLLSELEKESELAKKSLASSQAKETSSSKQVSAGLGGLSASEKKKLVAQYGCESDGDSGYPHHAMCVCVA